MTKFLNIRGVEDQTARAFSGGAAVRGITQAEYLARLLALRADVVAAARMGLREDTTKEFVVMMLQDALDEHGLRDVVA